MKRVIVSYLELSKEWRAEARRNLGGLAQETMYFEPLPDTNPVEHVLWDLSTAMRQTGVHKGFEYNAVIGISNNSAMLVRLSDCGEHVETMMA